MDTIICDISAFLFWRMPPLVRLLALGPEEDGLLCQLVGPERLGLLRREVVEASPFAGLADGGASHAHFGDAARALLDVLPLVAAFAHGPVDVLVSKPSDRRASQLVRPRVWDGGVGESDVVSVAPGLSVVTPAFALQQIAARATTIRTVMLASELCGCFSVYRGPEPVTQFLQELSDEGSLPAYSGWRAATDNDGRLTGLWLRPRLYTTSLLRRIAENAASPRGRARLVEAASIALEDAASPFEAQAGLLLGLSRRRGGEDMPPFRLNQRVALPPAAARIARQRACYCDIFWAQAASPACAGLDVECQSTSHHFGARSSASDADRTTALRLLGIEVVQLTHGVLADPRRFAIFVAALAEHLGVPPRPAFAQLTEAQLRLRRELFVDWELLPEV